MIEAGELDAGEKLTERRTAQILGIGRLGVREAMQRLEAEGLLRGRRERQGRYFDSLQDADPDEVLARYEVREAIEAQAARLAAKNMSKGHAAHLLDLAHRLELCWPTAGCDERAAAKMAFLEYLVTNCGNRLLTRVWRTHRLLPYAPSSQQFEEQIFGKDTGDKPNSTLIAEAIAAGDQDEAERVCRRSCRQTTEALRRTIAPTNGEDT